MAQFVHYADSSEAPNPGEQEVVGQIIFAMQRETGKVAEREHHAAHRPLGSIMRARLAAYPALSACRHERNRRPQTEPASIGDVPD